MRSISLLGGFIASTAITIVGTVATPAADNGQNRPVRSVIYDLFGRSVKADRRPDELVVVTMGKENCVWCGRQEPVTSRLVQEGYRVTVIQASDYRPGKNDPKVGTYPTLIFKRGGKIDHVNPGYLPYEKLAPQLAEPVKKSK